MKVENHKTKLYCPDSDIGDFILALQADFWIDEQDIWNINCFICGGEHHLGDMVNSYWKYKSKGGSILK